jgi:hypothetical protein
VGGGGARREGATVVPARVSPGGTADQRLAAGRLRKTLAGTTGEARDDRAVGGTGILMVSRTP